MFCYVSCIMLEVIGVCVEWLQDISVVDVMVEGVVEINVNLCGFELCMEWCYVYEDLWELINGFGLWGINLWVWVIEFWCMIFINSVDLYGGQQSKELGR